MRKVFIIIVILLIILAGFGIFEYNSLFGAVQKEAETQGFSVPLKSTTQEVIQNLRNKGFIKNEWAFSFALSLKKLNIEPGGYEISKSMDVWKIASVLTSEPYMKWVVIPEGLRKEQIAEILTKTLSWSDKQKEDWIMKYTAMKYDYVEGVYFPDTYLIPKDEPGLDISQRFINKFNTVLNPYLEKLTKENIKWTTALKIASIVQREAAGKSDMPLIAGILWNRLLKDMKLDIDATLQYARGDTGNGWWAPIKVEDKKIDSPYNTYLNKGLPPTPICNPGINAIDAVLNSEETDCLYYLHDRNSQIHCAKTYEEHKKNIEEFLK